MDIKRVLKLNGLILAPDASAFLTDSMQKHANQAESMKKFVNAILTRGASLDGNRVSKTICAEIMQEWHCETTGSDESFFIINAMEVPRFKYCRNTKKFVTLPSLIGGANNLLPASPAMKSFLNANRYDVVFQRVIRNALFAGSKPGSVEAGPHAGGFKLRPIEFLLALGSKEKNVAVLGMLTQLKNGGQWYLEDPSSLIKLDLSQARFHEGVFPEGAIVLVEGWHDEDVFHVAGIGLPPVESAATTRRYFGVSNPFGGGLAGIHCPAAADDPRMKRLLTDTQVGVDSMLVLLGETRLDTPGCLDSLETLFLGYSEFPPVAFVLCGDFVSPNVVGDKHSLLRQLFRRLCEAFLRAFGSASRQPALVLVVGPNDPSLSPRGILPRAPLPSDLFDGVVGVERGGKGDISLPLWLQPTSNPVRMRTYTREVVVFRYDYSRQLLRHCVHLPTSMASTAEDQQNTIDSIQTTEMMEDKENDQTSRLFADSSSANLGYSLAHCLTSQGHLTPVPLHVSPVFWAWDQALSLNPLPDLVVAVEPDAIADLNFRSGQEPPEVEGDPLGGCQFTNPGRFGSMATASASATASSSSSRIEYTFKVFYPNTRVIEDSGLSSG